MIIPVFILYYIRKDLILISLWTGLLSILISIPIFQILFVINPESVNWWYKDITFIFGMPLEDLIWFYVTGMFVTPLYELLKGYKLKKII